MRIKNNYVEVSAQLVRLLEDKFLPDWLVSNIIRAIHTKSRLVGINVWQGTGEVENLSVTKLAELFVLTGDSK